MVKTHDGELVLRKDQNTLSVRTTNSQKDFLPEANLSGGKTFQAILGGEGNKRSAVAQSCSEN